MSDQDDGPLPTLEEVFAAAADAARNKPGARVFIYVDSGDDDSEADVFATGADDEAAALLLDVADWLEAILEDDE
jgi:hypothetical protein